MNRIIAVTGAASGLGRATAELLEEQGDRVVRVDLREGDVTVDLSTSEGRAEAITKIGEEAPQLDGIVTWAGLGMGKLPTLLVNYFGTVELIEGVRPLLLRSNAPRVVVTASRMSLFPANDQLVTDLLAGDPDQIARDYPAEESHPQEYYISSKTALARWMRSRSVSAEWGGSGIAMNAIAPGLIETPMTQAPLADPTMRGPLLEMHPQANDTLSQPGEIAALASYLLSEPAGLLIGQCIWADRGTEAIIRGDQTW